MGSERSYQHPLDRLLRPRSVVLIGASDRNPFSQMAANNLDRFGFAGSRYMINPRVSSAHGRPALQSCTQIGESADAAFVCVPRAAVLEALEDAVAAGIKTFVLVSSGFAELGGAGAELQSRLEALVRANNLKLLGPNSLGYINFRDQVALGAMETPPRLRAGSIALVSASGSTGIQVAHFADQIATGFTHLVSTGNEAGVQTAEVVDFLIDDDAVRAVAVFAETIRDPTKFADVAIRALEMRKPIVILKVGRSPHTAKLVAAHTGSFVGNDQVFDAVCDRYGVVRVHSIEDLVVTSALMASTGPIRKSGVAFVSISGGACEMISDRGNDAGVPLPDFAAETQVELRKHVSDLGQTHNPLDLTGAAMRDPAMWGHAIRAVSRDPQIGLVLCNLDPFPGRPPPDWQTAWEHVVEALRASDPPGGILTSYLQFLTDEARQFLQDMEIPFVVSGIGTGLDAVAKTVRWSEQLRRRRVCQPGTIKHEAPRSKPRSERETLAYLGDFGVPTVPGTIARTPEEAVDAFRQVDGAVVLKIASSDIQHKTEVGGVLLNIRTESSVAEGFTSIMQGVNKVRPTARVEGVIVSPMRSGGIELLVGVARDPDWGPVLSLALGGVWVEALDDYVLELLPATQDDIVRAFGRLKGARLLTGYRGSPPIDLNALAGVIARIADAALSLGPDLDALEINPLLVTGDRFEALDALAAWKTEGLQ